MDICVVCLIYVWRVLILDVSRETAPGWVAIISNKHWADTRDTRHINTSTRWHHCKQTWQGCAQRMQAFSQCLTQSIRFIRHKVNRFNSFDVAETHIFDMLQGTPMHSNKVCFAFSKGFPQNCVMNYRRQDSCLIWSSVAARIHVVQLIDNGQIGEKGVLSFTLWSYSTIDLDRQILWSSVSVHCSSLKSTLHPSWSCHLPHCLIVPKDKHYCEKKKDFGPFIL